MTHSKEWKENWRKPIIKHNKTTKYGYRVSYPDKLILGRCFDIGYGTYIQALNGVVIESDVQIGPNCTILSESTIDNKHGKVILKKGCCIGANSVVMPSVTIGENTIVGACSFVNKDVPSNVVSVGIPCKIHRFV